MDLKVDVEKLKNRKTELDKKFNELNEVKKTLTKEMQNISDKIAQLNSEQIKLQGQFFEITHMLKELGIDEKESEKK